MVTLGEIGEIPTIFHGFVSLVSFWHRTSSMDEDTLVKQALNAMTNDNDVKSEWMASVQIPPSVLRNGRLLRPHTIDNHYKKVYLCV